jgi:hypothetical protein
VEPERAPGDQPQLGVDLLDPGVGSIRRLRMMLRI